MTHTLLTAIFLPLLVSFLFTAILTPIALIFIRKIGLFDDPASHKHPAILHSLPIPRAGGVPMFLGILFAAFIFLPLTRVTIALYLAGSLALIIGTLDDKLDISPYLRFFVNIITAGIIVSSGVGVPFITNPLGGVLHLNTISLSFSIFNFPVVFLLSDAVAMLWIVWVMNMLNWSKGVDGQMPGIVVISSIVIGILSLRFAANEPNAAIAATLSFIIAGSAFGFLLYNFYPAKIFPGYGATAIYLLLSITAIFSGAKLATAILVMGVPMVDGIFTIARRILTGHSPFRHDKKHLHHLLLQLGLGHRSIALFYWCISAILGAIALFLNSKGKFFAIMMMIVLIGGGIAFLHYLLKQKDDYEHDAL